MGYAGGIKAELCEQFFPRAVGDKAVRYAESADFAGVSAVFGNKFEDGAAEPPGKGMVFDCNHMPVRLHKLKNKVFIKRLGEMHLGNSCIYTVF